MGEAKPFDISKRDVWEAFKRVKANQGAAGVPAVNAPGRLATTRALADLAPAVRRYSERILGLLDSIHGNLRWDQC